MRTHFLDTRSRVRSIVMDIDRKPDGLRFYASYMINGYQHDDVYEITAVLVNEYDAPVKVRYERIN